MGVHIFADNPRHFSWDSRGQHGRLEVADVVGEQKKRAVFRDVTASSHPHPHERTGQQPDTDGGRPIAQNTGCIIKEIWSLHFPHFVAERF